MIIGKPRYLGLLHSDDVDLDKGMEVVISSARGEEIGVVAGPITMEQAETYRETLTNNGGDGAPRGGEPAFQDVKYLRPVTLQDERESASLREEEAQVLAQGPRSGDETGRCRVPSRQEKIVLLLHGRTES